MEIQTITDEQENKVKAHVEGIVVDFLNKGVGTDPRNKPNYQRWMKKMASTPMERAVNFGPAESASRAQTRLMVKAFMANKIHTEFATTLAKGSDDFAVEKGISELVSKTAEVTTVADLRTVAGTEYDPEIYQFPVRKMHFQDLMPSRPCKSGEVKFLREYGFSNNGTIPGSPTAAQFMTAEVDDPASPVTLTDTTVRADMVTTTVRNIRTKITVASDLLDDVEGLENFLVDAIERNGQYALSAQIASGDGTGQNLSGFYTDSALQSYLWSSGASGDNLADAVLGGIILAWLAEHEPDATPMHPSDWGAIIKAKDSILGYLIPSAHTKENAKTLWGVDVAVTTANPSGKCCPGSWATSAMLRDRQQSTLTWTRDFGTDRESDLVRLFYKRRVALQKLRPEGFCVVTFDSQPA